MKLWKNISRNSFKKITLRSAFVDYCATKKTLKPRTKDYYRETLERYLPDWMDRTLISISKNDIAIRHAQISTHAPYCANRVMDIFQAIWNFIAIEHYDMPRNPAEIYRKQGGRNKEVRRKTHLSDCQLPLFWKSIEQNDLVMESYIKTIYFTGMRRREAICLKWENCDFQKEKITVTNTKNGKPLILPITKELAFILMKLRSYHDADWLFPSPRGASHWQEPRKFIERARDRAGFHFTIHSLRNTYITVAKRRLGLQTEIVKALVNHSQGNDVTEGYAAPMTVEDLRLPAQAMASKLFTLANPIDS